MRRPRTSSSLPRWRRIARTVHHAVFDESREGRAAEVAAWSNAASALALGAGATALAWSRSGSRALAIGAATFVVAFVLLRLLLAHRVSVWFAAALGTLTVSALGGGLAWVFAHVVEHPAAPSIGAAIGALLAAALPAWSYGTIARRRRDEIPDSLLEPVSLPRSR
ncbi:MAG: hypothetical protein KF819_22860 [Labilithrix sp.]|nr:hypothetical protein [Labilithrix sp.]